MKRVSLALFTVFICFASKSFAQTQKVVADKIVAKIGDKIILYSDIYNAIEDYKRQADATGGKVN
ncbi:MAG TPA: hypothetical protein VHB48_16345, partial [Chitinophagaceae bacterium]|nr:hypothetical protein [Chitinophagaceae bacterium]